MSEISPGLENVYIKYTALTYIDGDKGIMRYRGYDINELAEKSTFERVSYLMLFGDLPDSRQLDDFINNINKHLVLDDYLKIILKNMPETTDSLGMLQTLLSARAATEINYKYTSENDKKMIPEILGTVLSMVANIYRIKSGDGIIDPEPLNNYASTFLKACFGSFTEEQAKAMDSALILYMDHEIPASTTAALVTASTLSDMYSSLASAVTALRGPLHGGAAEGAYRQFLEIGSPENVEKWFENNILNGNKRLVGFGHRVYRTFDPRLKTFKKYADILSTTEEQKNILATARKLEETGIKAFGKKGIYTNTDFYSGIVFHAIGFPVDMFTTLFGLSRISGILAQVTEYVETQERLIRPRAIYNGLDYRKYPD
ncbi:MAG: citrate/2-methylcitrate synthase [Ferroplasma sp.]